VGEDGGEVFLGAADSEERGSADQTQHRISVTCRRISHEETHSSESRLGVGGNCSVFTFWQWEAWSLKPIMAFERQAFERQKPMQDSCRDGKV
jgi:hypothetical protein